MAGKLAIMVCENLGREARAALQSSGFDDVRLLTFGSDCVRPLGGWERVQASIAGAARDFSEVHIIAGRGCVPDGDPPDSVVPCRIHGLEQCAHLLIDRNTADAYTREGAYLLTPGWLARWRQYLNDLGFDQKEASEFFKEFATCLVLLDTGVDGSSAVHLQELADFLGLRFHTKIVDLDTLRLRLENTVLRWRLESRDSETSGVSGTEKQSADYAMAFDLSSRLASIMNEPEAIDRVLDLFSMLFAPARLAYLRLDGDKPGDIRGRPRPVADAGLLTNRLSALTDEYAWTESGRGFLLLVAHHGERLGVMEIEDLAFPEYKEHYLNLALNIGRICGLAISNGRVYDKMKEAEQDLQAQRERLAVTLRSMGDGLIATDTEGRVVLFNRAAESLTGWAHDEAIGRPLAEIFHITNEQTRLLAESLVETVLETGSTVRLTSNTILIAKDGVERIIADSAARVVNGNGSIAGVVIVFWDVTEVEAARRQISRILESITDAFFAMDREWRLTYVNQEAARLMRKTRDELLGCSLWDEFPEAIDTTFYKEYHRAMSEQVAIRFEEYYLPFETWFEVHAYPSRDGLSVHFQDVNARKQMEKDLRESEKRIRMLAEAAVHSHEEERQWAADEVHDRVAQTLAPVQQQLQALSSAVQNDPPAQRLLNSTLKLQQRVIHETRNIMKELYSPTLERYGLVAIMQEELDQLQEQTGFQTRIDASCPRRSPRHAEEVLYRIFHEALMNVRKHGAGARLVAVSVKSEHDNVSIIVEDDGPGFDVEAVMKSKSFGGMVSMRRRAEIIGGSFEVKSNLGQGTRVRASVPARQANHPRLDE